MHSPAHQVRHRILTEASGSLTAAYLLNAIRNAGHAPVASDIDPDCYGRALADDFIAMPRASDPLLWEIATRLLAEHRVSMVIPSLDESLAGWAERKQPFLERGVHVITSDPKTIAVCRDKWQTYQFFRRIGVPTPATSLEQEFGLIKPRDGRGAAGVRITDERVDMRGLISQELMTGVEYTIDVFCDRASTPVYIVPRRRLVVRDGKSLDGAVEIRADLVQWVRHICAALPFVGPINLQCFVTPLGETRFIEINPRIAGGMALGFAATENWIPLIVSNLVEGRPIEPVPIRDRLQMRRYYAEIFVPGN